MIIICALILTVEGEKVLFAVETVEEATVPSVVDKQTIKDLVELAKKYEVTGKLPGSTIVEGKPCTKEEAVICLLAIIEKIIDKSQKRRKRGSRPGGAG